jgi:hypothetical protein
MAGTALGMRLNRASEASPTKIGVEQQCGEHADDQVESGRAFVTRVPPVDLWPVLGIRRG